MLGFAVFIGVVVMVLTFAFFSRGLLFVTQMQHLVTASGPVQFLEVGILDTWIFQWQWFQRFLSRCWFDKAMTLMSSHPRSIMKG